MIHAIGLLPRLLHRLRRNPRGNVTMLFAFVLVSLLVGVGSAVDYSQAARSRTHISTSADAAALAAAKAAQTYMDTAGTSAAAFTAATVLAQQAMTQTFNANQAGDTYSQGVTATLAMRQAADGSPIATVTSTANAPTTFMKLVGIRTVPVGASAEAKGAGGTYYQIVFVIDVSNSMGIGGTPSDITSLTNDRTIQCAFACHDPNGTMPVAASDWCNNSPLDYWCRHNGPTYCPWGANACQTVNPSPTYSDRRGLAKLYGYKLKIDYVKDALGTFISQIKPKMDRTPQFFDVSIQTFGTTAQTVQAATNNSTVLQNAANTIDVEVAARSPAGYANQGWTYTRTGLTTALANTPNIGNGSSPTRRLTYFIFMSDGVEDIFDNPGYIYNRKSTLDYTAACDSIKAAGAQMFSIEAAYPSVPGDNQYNILIGQLPGRYSPQKTIAQAMQQCASSASQYFYADDGPGISTAVQNVFNNIFGVGTLHLSK